MIKKLFFIFVFGLSFGPSWAWAAQEEKKGDAYSLYLKSLLYESQGNLAMAEQHLVSAIELTPDSPSLYRDLAKILFRMGKFHEAGDSIEKAIELDPGRVGTHILAGQIFWAKGDNILAEEQFKKAVELEPDEAEPLMNLAMAVTPTQPDRAIQLYKGYLNRHPGETGIRERVAQLYQGMGQISEAKKEWEKILEWEPDSLRAHLSLAQIAEVDSDTTTAISHYEAVMVQDPSNLPLLLRIGELRYRNNDMTSAYEAFSKAQSIAPESASANFWLALFNEQNGEWEKAIKLLEHVAEKAEEPGIMLRLSYYYSQAGKKKKGIQVLEDLSGKDPDNTDFLSYLAVAYEDDQQLKKAEKVLNRLAALKPNQPEPLFQLGTLYDQMGKFPKAEEVLKKAIEIRPDFHMALNYLGYSYADRGIKLKEAEEYLNTAIALDPSNGAYLDSLGWVYFKQGKLGNAEDFLRLATVQAKDPLIWEHLGDVQAAQEFFTDAILSWDESLRLKPLKKSVKKKIRLAIKELSNKEKAQLFLKRSSIFYGDLQTLKSFVEVKVCQTKPCFESRAQLQYARGVEMTVEIPGPLSGPVMLLVKPFELPCQYGAIHPLFQSVEFFVTRAFERIDSVMTGVVFKGIDWAEMEKNIKVRGSEISTLTNLMEIKYKGPLGRLSEIQWRGPEGEDRLNLMAYQGADPLAFPNVWEWKDGNTGFSIKIKMHSPFVKYSPMDLDAQTEEKIP